MLRSIPQYEYPVKLVLCITTWVCVLSYIRTLLLEFPVNQGRFGGHHPFIMNDEPRPREHTTHTGGVQGPQTFQCFLAQTFSEPHRHMPSYPECHVFESHRRYHRKSPVDLDFFRFWNYGIGRFLSWIWPQFIMEFIMRWWAGVEKPSMSQPRAKKRAGVHHSEKPDMMNSCSENAE